MNRELLARKCVQIEKAGGSVREYLQSCGCISPWGTWFRLQREELGREKCQITDGKGGAEMRKITLADKKKAVEIAISGGNLLPYLKGCGSKNPSAAWFAIKSTLKETDPETYGKLPDLRKVKEEPEIEEPAREDPEEAITVSDAMSGIQEAADEFFGKCEEMGICTERKEPGRQFDVLSIRETETGETFSYDPKCGVMEWRTEAGDEVIMHPDHWRGLAEKLPRVLQILGI